MVTVQLRGISIPVVYIYSRQSKNRPSIASSQNNENLTGNNLT